MSVYHETAHGVLYHGDCLEILPTIADKSVDLAITSPPYDNLREYGEEKGYNFTMEMFSPIAVNLFRTIKHGGIVVWIVNDATINGSETGTSFRQALHFMDIGFNLHDTMIWEKPNFANPSSNRYHSLFEYMFVLSVGKPATFNPIKDKHVVYGVPFGQNTTRQVNGEIKSKIKKTAFNKYGMRGNVWKINTSGQENICTHISHPATFPVKLALDHIESWSNNADTVLDPFAGSGTTAIACIRLNRRYILIEKEEKYCEIAAKRIDKELDQMDIFRINNNNNNNKER